MSAIEARAVHKVYGNGLGKGQLALAGLDLTVARGTVFGLIGPNGAGKTTFIKIMLDVVRPTAGDVLVLGGPPASTRVRRRIGYLPERLQLPPSWTPTAFLRSVARFKRLAASATSLRRSLEQVGLGPDAGRRIRTFSKGMRRRLGLATALLGEPELLILDEPTDGLDPLWRAEVRRMLEAARARGATVFLNSHLLAETERVCDRVGIIAQGRMVKEGRLDELRACATRWRLRFAGPVDSVVMLAAGLEPDGEQGWLLRAPNPVALNRTVDHLRATGLELVHLARDERSLEEVLSEAVHNGKAAA